MKQNKSHKQISSDELRFRLERVAVGDQKAFEDLLQSYSPLISSMVSKFHVGILQVQDEEDLRQEAIVAFYRAASTFLTDQNQVTFGSYAKTCIRNCLISFQRQCAGRVVAETDIVDNSVADDPGVCVMESERLSELTEKINSELNSFERSVWWEYVKGKTAKQIGVDLGHDEKSVSNAVYRVRRKLRKLFSEP